ncbi:MAG: LysM domain-containing protein [Actinomycetota bacterium]|nr:LysM domain-containing protein [Actinomycetota bacterium]MDA8281560.1 LysM domain-containing protein [Actinomycetota bacterium]
MAGALGLLAAPIWGHPTAVGVIPVSPTAATFPRVYVVQRGDTLRSIASRVDGGQNERAVVTDLRAQLDGAPLAPGLRLVLP